jgi:DNA invertase Pin-like site-specific DNA recombinase
MNDEDGELRLTIMATLAQNESKKTSMRVKAGQMVSFQNGGLRHRERAWLRQGGAGIRHQ